MRLGYKMIKHYSGCVELIGNRLNAKVVCIQFTASPTAISLSIRKKFCTSRHE